MYCAVELENTKVKDVHGPFLSREKALAFLGKRMEGLVEESQGMAERIINFEIMPMKPDPDAARVYPMALSDKLLRKFRKLGWSNK